MINDETAKYNYNKVASIIGLDAARKWFTDWTTFKDQNLSVSDALSGINECEIMAERYERTVINN